MSVTSLALGLEILSYAKELDKFSAELRNLAALCANDTELAARRERFLKIRRKLLKLVNSSSNLVNFKVDLTPLNTNPTRARLRFEPCFYCGVYDYNPDRTLDHFVPSGLRGSNRRDNLVAACKKCNNNKGDRLPTPGEVRKFQHLRPFVSLSRLLDPWGFLTEEQQTKMNWFMLVWAANIAVYRENPTYKKQAKETLTKNAG